MRGRIRPRTGQPIQKQKFSSANLERKKAVRRKDPPFESVEGILTGNYDNIDQDIAEMRTEVWKNFPREFE